MVEEQNNLMDKIVALSKRRGFVYPSSEIYGGLANAYDYGPMGAELLRNIRNAWWKYFINQRSDMVGLDSSIILHPQVWMASGHVASFTDAMVDCKNCRLRTRADHLIEDFLEVRKEDLEKISQTDKIPSAKLEEVKKTGKVEGWSTEEMDELIKILQITCPNCKQFAWTPVRKFNLLFETNIGIVSEDQSKAYLRGETAQGIFINFKNILDSTRVKFPFGVGQIGKSFRNEITKGNFIFRTLEFEQAEIEYFFDPEKEDWEKLFESWKKSMWQFATENLGVRPDNLRWRVHTDEERSFYSKRTEDMEYNYPFGFKELWGIAYRTDYDLKQHQQFAHQDLTVLDQETGRKFIPHVIEPAAGVTRMFLMILVDSYSEKEGRVFLKLKPSLAPYKVAVFPLLANKPDLVEKAKNIYNDLKVDFTTAWDDRGNIGKRYASQDEIGTPFCVTVDFQSLEDNAVTVRDRDTAEQVRVNIDELKSFLREKIGEI